MSRPASKTFLKALRASSRKPVESENHTTIHPPAEPVADSGRITCDPRRGFNECGVCFAKDDTVQMLAFHWQNANVGSSISIPLCSGCRRKTVQVLREVGR